LNKALTSAPVRSSTKIPLDEWAKIYGAVATHRKTIFLKDTWVLEVDNGKYGYVAGYLLARALFV
jgi:hypothetical protein